MKKTFKVGKVNIKWDLIAKLVIASIVAIVIFFVVKIVTDEISKLLGWIPNVIGGAGNSFAKCFDCKNQRDANGKLMDPKDACPPWGFPFLNAECGAFFGTIAFSLLALLAGVLIILKYKGGRTEMSESAKIHNNLTDKEQKEMAERSKQEVKDLMDTPEGKAAYENYKDNLEREAFKNEWEKDPKNEKVPDGVMNDKTKFDDWIKNTAGKEAEALQTKTRNTIDKKISIKDFTKSITAMRTSNTFKNEGHPSSPAQRSAAENARAMELRDQGAALADKAGFDAAGRKMADEYSKKGSEGEKQPWEKAADGK